MKKEEGVFLQKDINICFLAGTIVSDVKFNFVYNSKKYVSVAEFFIKPDMDLSVQYLSKQKVKNSIIDYNSSVKVKAYDDIADAVYKNFEKGNFIKLTRCINFKLCLCNTCRVGAY